MIEDIRQLLFQMLVLAEYQGDKNAFIAEFIKKSQKDLLPAYASTSEYYTELQKSIQKSVGVYIKRLSPKLSAIQKRNLKMLANSFSSL